MARSGPFTLTAHISSSAASSPSSSVKRLRMPALFTSASSRPCAATASAIHDAALSGCVAS
jgi:hypothetical protein